MDKMKEISKLLYTRSLHRMFGNPTVGTLTGFLTMIYIIRTSVNLYFVNLISGGNACMESSQIAAGWFLYLGTYFIICSSLSAFHISFALPKRCFICLTPEGKRFRSGFLKHAAFIRPMNLVVAVLAVTGLFIFCGLKPGFKIILTGILILTVSMVISFFIFRLTEIMDIGMLEVQLIEAVMLSLLVLINPDVINSGGIVRFLIFGKFIPFNSAAIIILSFIFVTFITISLLILTKIISILNAKFHDLKLHTGPLESWHLHFFKITYWLVLYLFIFSVLLSDFISASVKQKITAGFIIFNLISYIVFIIHCENIIRTKFRKKLLTVEHILLTASTFLSHILLTFIPVLTVSIIKTYS